MYNVHDNESCTCLQNYTIVYKNMAVMAILCAQKLNFVAAVDNTM